MKKQTTPTPKQRIEKLKVRIELLNKGNGKKNDIQELQRELMFWKNRIRRH